MEFPTHSFLLFSLLALFVVTFPADAAPQPNMIANVCSGLTERDRCLAAFVAMPTAALAKDYVELSKIVLKYCVRRAGEGQKKIKAILETNKAPAIEQCAHFHYEGTVNSFKSSLQELIEDPMTANYDAGVSHDGPMNCESGLAQAHIVNPEISAINNEMLFLSAVASRATDNIPQGQDAP